VPKRPTALVLSLCAAGAVAGCAAAEPPQPASDGAGTTSVVIPRLPGLDVANAVAEVHYLGMISAVVGDEQRPVRHAGACTVVAQDPRPRTEVVVDDLTVTVTMTVRCQHG